MLKHKDLPPIKGRKLEEQVTISHSFQQRQMVSLSPPPIEPKSSEDHTFQMPTSVFPLTTTNAILPPMGGSKRIELEKMGGASPSLMLLHKEQTLNQKQEQRSFVPRSVKMKSAQIPNLRGLSSGSVQMAGNQRERPRDQRKTGSMTLNLKHISGRRLQDDSQEPVLHISDSFLSPHGTIESHKQMLSPSTMPVSDPNISINLEEVASSAEFEALQRRIAAHTPVILQNRPMEYTQKETKSRSASSTGYIRSQTQQPKQLALHSLQPTKRGASQVARRSTAKTPNSEINRSKSVTRNKQPKQERKPRSRDVTTEAEQIITGLRSGSGQIMGQEGKRSSFSSVPASSRPRETIPRHQMHPSFGTIEPISEQIQEETQPSPEQNVTLQKELVKEIERPRKNITETLRRTMESKKFPKSGLNNTHTWTITSNRKDSKIDKIIRANLKQKRAQEAVEKLRKLREVEQQIARKKTLVQSNLIVRQKNAPKGTGLTPTITPQRPTPTKAVAHSFDMNDILAQQQDVDRPRSLVQEINRNFRQVEQEVERNFGRKLGRVAVSSDGPPSKLWNQKHFKFPQVHEGPEQMSSPQFSHGFSPVTRPRIRQTPQFQGEYLLRQHNDLERGPILKRDVSPINKSGHNPSHNSLGRRTHQFQKSNPLIDRAATLRDKLTKLDQFARKVAISKKPKPVTHHIRKDTLHTSAILESRHMSGRMIATIEVDANDQTEIAAPPKKIATTKIKRTLSKKKQQLEGNKSQKVSIPKEPQVKVLKSLIKLNTKKRPKKVKQITETKKVTKKPKGILNTSNLNFVRPSDVTTPDHNLRTPSAYKYSPGSLSPPQIQKRVGKKKLRTEYSSGLSNDNFSNKPSSVYPPPKPKVEVQKPKQKKPVTVSSKILPQKAQKGPTSKREQIEKAHALFKLLKMKEESDDPEVQKALAEYQEILDNLLPQSHQKPKQRPKSGKKEKSVPLKEKKSVKELMSTTPKNDMKEKKKEEKKEEKKEDDEEEVVSEIVTVKRNADKLTPPAPPKVIALPDQQDSTSILDNLNLVLHPSDPKNSAFDSIEYDEEDKQVINADTVGSEDAMELLNNAATIIQRAVRVWLQQRRELQEYVSNAPINPLLYYPDGSPIDANVGNDLEDQEVEMPEEMKEEEVEADRERLRQAVEYLSMKEQEVGRQLTEEEYVGLLKEAGAEDELIYQVMQLGLEEDDELEQLQNQFAGEDDEGLQYLDEDLDTAGGEIESDDELHQPFVRWKSVPQILILPQLVKQELNQDEERAELMVMQYWQPQEEAKLSNPTSEIDSMAYIQATHSPGMIVHEDERGHTLEEELKHAIAGVDNQIEDMSPPEMEVHQGTNLASGSSTLNELNKIIGEEEPKQGEFTLGYDDLDEESSSRNVVHISMIHQHDLIDHQEEHPRSSPPEQEEDEQVNESNMLVDDSRVDESLEELVRPTQERTSELIPAINEVLKEQKQGHAHQAVPEPDVMPLGSPYINIIEDVEERSPNPGEDREDQEEEEEEVYFEDPDHQLDQFDNIDIPEEKEEDLKNVVTQMQITPKPKLEIDIISPDSGETSPHRLKGLPPPVPRPRQLVPALDLRNLSRTQQMAQKEQQLELLKGFHESNETKSLARSMFERNSFHDFTSSQRGDLQSQRDMVRQMKEDINIEDLEAFHTDKKPVDRILKTRQLSPTAQISNVKEMQEWLEEEKRQNRHSERKKASIGSDWQSAAFLIEQTQQSTERIQKIFSERGVSSHRSRTISNGGSIPARLVHNGQPFEPHSQYNAAGYSTSAARSARVSWRHYSYGVGSNSIPQTVSKHPMSKSKSSELESSPGQQPQVIGKEEPWTSPFNEEQPYLQQEGSISKARHSQPPLTIGGDKILGQSQTEEPKRGLSRTKSQDYLEKRREEKGAQGVDAEKRKPSPQMLEFYKQDKSIEEALDDEIVESIDMETVEGFGEEHGDPSLLLQYKTDTSKRDKVRQKNLRDILGTSQEQSGEFPLEREHFADQMYNDMVSGDINDEDLMRSAQKDTDEEGFFSQSNDADRSLMAPGLNAKEDFNKLHSLHDLKKTLEEVRKHTEEEEEEDASGEIHEDALPHANLSGPYEDLFGPGGLQSPRTIPEVDLSHLMLTGGSLGSAKMLTTGQIGRAPGHHYQDPKFGSGESLEVLQHLESDHMIGADVEKLQQEQNEVAKQSTEVQSSTPEQKEANISVGIPQSSEDDESAQSLQEIEIQLPAKDAKGTHKEASAGMTVPLPMAQIADLPVDGKSDEDQRHAAEMAIAIHSFGSLQELLQDKTGLREKALQIVSDQIFQAIVNRDLVLPPQLFPNREEQQILRKRRAVLQEQRRQQQNSTPSILRIPGVNTSMQAIAEFLDRVVTEIMEDEQLYRSLELKLKQPFTKDPFSMLEQLQNSQIGSYAHFLTPQYAENSAEQMESGIIPKIEPPLSKELFENIQRKQKEKNAAEEEKEKDKEEESKELQERKEELKQLVEESKTVHDQLIFNCFNQALDEQRPYGKQGDPMPWAVGQKLLECERAQGKLAERTRKIPLKQKLLKAKSRVLMSSAFRAGVFPSMQFVHQGVFDEEQFSTQRERRLAAFLANEVLQSEFKWLSYGFEEAQVKIDLGDMILERLVTEAIYILDGIEQNYLEEKQTKSIFAHGGFLQQQQELFQLTLSRSMNEVGEVKRASGLENSLGASSGGAERKEEVGMFDQ